MQHDGVFHGSPVDEADGYIHLSCGSQVAATLDKHFSGMEGLMLVAVDLSWLGDSLRWEPARGENCSRTSTAACRWRQW